MSLLSAIESITLELTHAECPCGHCMGPGCDDCLDTGADLDSLKSIRKAFAEAIELTVHAPRWETERLAKEIRESEAR